MDHNRQAIFVVGEQQRAGAIVEATSPLRRARATVNGGPRLARHSAPRRQRRTTPAPLELNEARQRPLRAVSCVSYCTSLLLCLAVPFASLARSIAVRAPSGDRFVMVANVTCSVVNYSFYMEIAGQSFSRFLLTKHGSCYI